MRGKTARNLISEEGGLLNLRPKGHQRKEVKKKLVIRQRKPPGHHHQRPSSAAHSPGRAETAVITDASRRPFPQGLHSLLQPPQAASASSLPQSPSRAALLSPSPSKPILGLDERGVSPRPSIYPIAATIDLSPPKKVNQGKAMFGAGGSPGTRLWALPTNERMEKYHTTAYPGVEWEAPWLSRAPKSPKQRSPMRVGSAKGSPGMRMPQALRLTRPASAGQVRGGGGSPLLYGNNAALVDSGDVPRWRAYGAGRGTQ